MTMHPDLMWLAVNYDGWADGWDYAERSGNRFRFCAPANMVPEYGRHFCKGEIMMARQKLGLDQTEVTTEEEEAWQDKERQLIGGPRKAENFLMQAADLMTERGKQYDQPGGERSMGKAVTALNAITGRDLTEAEGWLLMSLVKRVRQHSGAGYHQDSAEDAVAYAALEAEALESAGK